MQLNYGFRLGHVKTASGSVMPKCSHSVHCTYCYSSNAGSATSNLSGKTDAFLRSANVRKTPKRCSRVAEGALTWYKLASLHDQVIASLADESDHLGRCIVETGVLPDQQHGVKHWLEQLCKGCEVVHGVQLLQILPERFEVLDSVVGLQTSCCYILQQPAGHTLINIQVEEEICSDHKFADCTLH